MANGKENQISSDADFEELLNSFLESDNQEEPEPKEKSIPKNVPQQTASEGGMRKVTDNLNLGAEEKELANAYANFFDCLTELAGKDGFDTSGLSFDPESLIPNYKPSIGRHIEADLNIFWETLIEKFPDKFANFNLNSSDEAFLNFAETLPNQNMQLAVISYVEILINIEGCEINYEKRRLKAQRRRIERELYEEYQRRQERKQRFIEAVLKRQFPVDAERLINNYFKTAQKDADGAFEALVKNPAVYAPIEIHKIKPRLLGLIKPTPKDGIRENKRLGKFLKNLKA